MEYWFYHLEQASVEAVLPQLLEKTQSKGWRSLVKMSEDCLPQMDKYLWTYRDNSFLPHGRDDEPLSDRQPICLTSSAEQSGGAACVILLDQSDIAMEDAVVRCIILIDGQKSENVSHERLRWKRLKGEGAKMSYWQQNDRGEWKKMASS